MENQGKVLQNPATGEENEGNPMKNQGKLMGSNEEMKKMKKTNHACMHMYVRIYIHTYIHTYVRTYVRTYIHT